MLGDETWIWITAGFVTILVNKTQFIGVPLTAISLLPSTSLTTIQQQWRWVTVPSIFYHIGDTWTSQASQQTILTPSIQDAREVRGYTEHWECQVQTQLTEICSMHWGSACESTDLCSQILYRCSIKGICYTSIMSLQFQGFYYASAFWAFYI